MLVRLLTLTFLYAAPLFSQTQSIPDIAEKAVGSVVNISSVKVIRYQGHPFFEDPFFQQFFGTESTNPFGVPREQRQRSLGSGVIVSADGYILTNHHVVADTSEVTVAFKEGTEVKAKLIGTDPPTDVALLQAKLPKNISPLPMGNSDSLRLGETVIAIGSPFGLGGTVTSGIVSAKGRANVGIADYEDFIQTDAAINPGNSGGALLNQKGELVGINTAIYSRSGGYQGIGFAIPIHMAKYVMQSLIKTGNVERGWLGLRYQDVTSEIAKALGLLKSRGVIVTAVVEGSPASLAGVQPGDVIVKFNREEVEHSGHLSRLLSETPIGTAVGIQIVHEKKEVLKNIIIVKRPEQPVRRRQRRQN